MSRTADYVRKTKETDITLSLELDGSGVSEIDTGIGFFDHMLEGFARHGFFRSVGQGGGRSDRGLSSHDRRYRNCARQCDQKGGRGTKKGIKRYGSCILPMDETLVLCAVDLSGRPYLSFDGNFTVERVGYMDTEMVKEFFYAISYTAGMNLHIKVLTPGNNHHMIEAMFKAFARALDEATSYDPRITDILSTKGSL